MSKITSTKFDKDLKVWSGSLRVPLINPMANLGQIMLEVLERTPDKITQISDDSGRQMTCAEMRSRSICVAHNLTRLGYKSYDMICIAAKNSEYIACIVIGCFLIGAPINTLDPLFDEADLSHMMGLTKPKLVFCDQDNVKEVKDALNLVNLRPEILITEKDVDGLMFKSESDEDFYECSEGEDYSKLPVVVMCTSGTTGVQKGACLSHSQMIEQLYKLWPLEESAIHLCFSSLFWITGLGSIILGTIGGATRLITKHRYSPEYQLHLIDKYKVTDIMNPTVYMDTMLKCPNLEKYHISSIKNYVVGGSTVSESLRHKMQSKLSESGKVLVTYGLSEMAGLVSCAESTDNRPGSVGKLMPRVKVKIVDDDGNNVGVGAMGEICAKSSFKFLGYYGNEEATNQTLEEDGWIHTGDVGYFDEDGFLYLTYRKKDIIKYNNFQISPSELEALIANYEGVEMVCVVGVKADINDLAAAAIVLSEGAEVTEEEIIDCVDRNVSDFKRLRGGVYFVNKLPTNNCGEVQRKLVLKIVRRMFDERKHV